MRLKVSRPMIGIVKSSWLACLAIAIASGACQGRKPLPEEGTVPSGGAGGSAGGSPIGGVAGNGGADAGGAAGGEDPSRARTLAPLATDDATIDQASGAALFDLARAIGYAEGYAQCSCFIPTSPVEELDGCSIEESGFRALFPPMQARCILQVSRDVPGFDEYLRCRIKRIRTYGKVWAECAMGKDTRPDFNSVPACTASEDVQVLLVGGTCSSAFYCADGTFAMHGRCDFVEDCPDLADERGCGHFICGDKLIDPGEACDSTVCSATFTPPLCVPGMPEPVLCGDGNVTTVFALCNDTKECPNGRDEELCF